MQVYKPHQGAYQLYQVDKYYGRKISSESGFKRELEVSWGIYFSESYLIVLLN
jgi:hypothetical protein